MADQDLSRSASARNESLRSELETQETLNLLLAEVARLQARLDALEAEQHFRKRS